MVSVRILMNAFTHRDTDSPRPAAEPEAERKAAARGAWAPFAALRPPHQPLLSQIALHRRHDAACVYLVHVPPPDAFPDGPPAALLLWEERRLSPHPCLFPWCQPERHAPDDSVVGGRRRRSC